MVTNNKINKQQAIVSHHEPSCPYCHRSSLTAPSIRRFDLDKAIIRIKSLTGFDLVRAIINPYEPSFPFCHHLPFTAPSKCHSIATKVWFPKSDKQSSIITSLLVPSVTARLLSHRQSCNPSQRRFHLVNIDEPYSRVIKALIFGHPRVIRSE